MAYRNPLKLDVKNIAVHKEDIKHLISNSKQKNVLFFIHAEWCGYCKEFKRLAWDEFMKKFKATSHFQIVEIDYTALNWLSINDKVLHGQLLLEPPNVYYPQIYMLSSSKTKKAFRPDYSSNTLGLFEKFVNGFIKTRKNVKGKAIKKGGEIPKSKKSLKAQSYSQYQTNKSLKDEIDAAFKKLLLQ